MDFMQVQIYNELWFYIITQLNLNANSIAEDFSFTSQGRQAYTRTVMSILIATARSQRRLNAHRVL